MDNQKIKNYRNEYKKTTQYVWRQFDKKLRHFFRLLSKKDSDHHLVTLADELEDTDNIKVDVPDEVINRLEA